MAIERFGEKLRRLREQHNMSLVDVAHVLGYGSTTQVDHLEKGRRNPTAELVLKVSKLFNVSADDLVDDGREVGEDTP
jgi:transcriptional regulator with XRE-family HTH domain